MYTYLPEHTLQLENHFNNLTNCRPVIFGYDAYIEIPKTTGYESSLLRHHYAGLMSMNTCGVNSQAVKDTIIEHAPSCLPDKDVEILKDKIEPLPRGWDNVEGPRKKPQKEPKIIVWNHRANSYKSYPWFLQQMDKLWEQRKDFTVWVPLADSIDREYIYNTKFDRQGYFTELSKCWVGVCGKSYHKGWVNSAADDAAGLAVANKMQSQLRGMNIALKNTADGLSLLQTAIAGMQMGPLGCTRPGLASRSAASPCSSPSRSAPAPPAASSSR